MLRAPSLGEAVALHRIFVHTLQSGLVGTVAVAFLQIHQQARRSFGIGVAVNGNTVGSRKLGTHAVVHQQRIVAGSHFLVRVRIVGRAGAFDVVLFATGRTDLAHVGHQKHVTQVGTARAAEVRMAEADQYAVRIMIARAPVPAFMNVLRPNLHHAQGNTGADKDMSVLARTDVGVYVAEVVLPRYLVFFLRNAGGRQHSQQSA